MPIPERPLFHDPDDDNVYDEVPIRRGTAYVVSEPDDNSCLHLVEDDEDDQAEESAAEKTARLADEERIRATYTETTEDEYEAALRIAQVGCQVELKHIEQLLADLDTLRESNLTVRYYRSPDGNSVNLVTRKKAPFGFPGAKHPKIS